AARKAKLRLDDRDVAVQREAITPGQPNKSEMIARICSDDAKRMMPPAKLKKPLSAAQKEMLRRWIHQGAVYERHWAFQAIPKTTVAPKIDKNAAWVRSPIDAFVIDRLQREKLEPAAEAPREAWLRRVTFDLTGLPPTLAEIDAFLADQSDAAYAKV